MSLILNGSSVKQITCDGSDVKRVIFNGASAWAKPYDLTISKGTGVSNVAIERGLTYEPTAPQDVLAGIGTIYHGDELYIEATAQSGYVLDSYETRRTVSGNTTVSVTAHSAASWQTLFSGSVSKTITASGNNSVSFTKTGIWTNSAAKIRITGTVQYGIGAAKAFTTEATATYNSNGYYTFSITANSATSGYYVKLTQASQSALSFTAYGMLSSKTSMVLKITKIELYGPTVAKLSAPMSYGATWDRSEFFWEISNENSVAVTAHLEVYANEGVLVSADDYEISAYETIEVYAYVNSSSYDELYAEVYFSAAGYSDSEITYYEV